MFIKLDNKNRVILTSTFDREDDGITSFRVPVIPERKEGKSLCFNPETKEFYEEDIPDYSNIKAEINFKKELESIEKEEKDAIFEAMKIIVENYHSDKPEWQEWYQKHNDRKNRREEIKQKYRK